MNSIRNIFIEEINDLLAQFAAEGTLENYKFEKALQWPDPINYSGKLNVFDEEQLSVEFTPAVDRLEIDRIITLAEKSFVIDKFNDFLITVGQLCISHGKLNLAKEIFSKVERANKRNLFKAQALYFTASIESKSAHWDNASKNLVKSRNLYRSLGDKNGIAKCENLLGTICGNQGKIEEANKHFENSFALVDKSIEVELAAQIEMNLGIINNIKGNFENAVQYLKSSLNRLEKIGNLVRIAEVRHNLGMMYSEQAKHELALEQFDESIKVSIEAGLQPLMGLSYLSKAVIYVKKEEYGLADAFATKSYDICYGLDDKQSLAEIYKIKGMIERLSKSYENSEKYLLSSLRLNEKFKDDLNLAETSFELAKLYGAQKRESEEKNYLSKALEYYQKIHAEEKIKELKKLFDNRITA